MMSGHVGNLSNKQSATLAEFRENVKDLLQERPKWDDDHNLLRWLRARNFDLKKSEAMLRASQAWRLDNNIDTILKDFEPPEVIKKYFCGGVCGQDKEGSLLYIDTSGLTDIKGILMSLRKQDVIKSRVWMLEDIYKQCEEKTEEQGRRVNQITMVYDLDKFGVKHLWKPGVDVFTEIISICESNYPETLKKVFIINAPRIFPIAYSMLRPFLNDATHRKVTICGSNYKDVLLSHIEPDQLPVYWGGTLTDKNGDPRCSTMLVAGGPVPKEYYGNNSLGDLTGFTEASIGRGSTLQLDYDIKEPGTTIRWQFKTDGFDVGFGVFCRTSDQRQSVKDMEPIIASQRVNSHMIPEYGIMHCKKGGTYVVRFDNTFSWMRTKKLFYSIEILEPKELDVDGASNTCTAANETKDDVWTSFGDDEGGKVNDENTCSNGVGNGDESCPNGKGDGS